MWTCRGERTRSKAKSDPSPSVHFAVRWTPVEEIAQKRCVAQDGRSRTLTVLLGLHPFQQPIQCFRLDRRRFSFFIVGENVYTDSLYTLGQPNTVRRRRILRHQERP